MTLEKLSGANINRLNDFAEEYKTAQNDCEYVYAKQAAAKIRGYLAALRDLDIITPAEASEIYWYFRENA